jgi:hypothetical protein
MTEAAFYFIYIGVCLTCIKKKAAGIADQNSSSENNSF